MLAAFARRRPFTRQYAAGDATHPHILLSAAWAGVFALMSALDAAVLFAGLAEAASSVLGLVALAGALTFTLRYPAIIGGDAPTLLKTVP